MDAVEHQETPPQGNAAGAPVALSAKGLGKDFRGFRAVKNVDLDVVEGEVHALVGPNGAGKTTLFNLLTGYIKPTEGTITVNGKDITGKEPEQIAHEGVARSFQITSLFDNLSAATTELTGAQCNAYTFHYAYDTYQLANGTGKTVTENGAKDWQIIYPDYAFGQDMDKSFTAAIEAAGGTVGGHIATPFPNDNFSTFLTKAAGEKPDVIGTMQAGGDLINLVKQYGQAGLADQGIGLAVGLMFITDIHSLGVEPFKGVTFTDAWYWDMDDESRAWADRFLEETGGRPSFAHAANYSATKQYLEAIQQEGSDDADTVVGHLEGKEVDDVFLRDGKFRAEDHRVIHDVYLAKVKDAADVKEDWDYQEIVSTIPAAEAFRPVEDSIAAGCNLGD